MKRGIAICMVIIMALLALPFFYEPREVLAEKIGTTYYVDSLHGNDDNNGTSENTPWKTARNVNRTTFQPGDRILLKAGSVWNGERFAPLGSGAEGAQITIDKYGDGNKPVLNGNGAVNECVYLNNQEYWDIRNLEITNDAEVDAGDRRGIYIRGENGGELNSIHISDCDIHDIKGVVWGSINGRGDQYTCGGIRIWIYGKEFCKFDDLKIENCNFWHSTGMAINMQSDYAGASLSDNSRKSTNVVVRNVYTSDIGASAIIIGDCMGLLVDHVATMDNGFYIDDYRIGVMVPNFEIRTYDCVYQYCEVARQPWSNDGMAWDVDWGNGGTHIYQYNYSHENPNGVYMLCNAQEASQGCQVIFRYNISQNDGTGKFRHSAGSGTNDLFYNNTIYNEEGGVEISGGSGWKFYNNIFDVTGPALYGNCVYDFNCYNGNSGPASDAHKVLGDPKFAYPGRADDGIETADAYKLLAGSPCINAGMTVENNGGQDFFGNALYTGAPDIGAHEATAGEAAPAERAKIVSYDDSCIGDGVGQFRYRGSWSGEVKSFGYENGIHKSNTAGDMATFTFSGTKIRLYATKNTDCGIGAVSIDGGEETLVDFYNPGADAGWIPSQDGVLVYTSPELAPGNHTLTLRVTGTKGSYATDHYVSVDRGRVNNGSEGQKPENIAKAKAVTAGGEQAENLGANANDGDASTRWCASSGDFPQTWTVDLGEVYDLTGTKILWEESQAYAYKIDGSLDNQSWNLLADRRENRTSAQMTRDEISGSARYLKLTVTGVSGNKWASMWEFEAFGTKSQNPPRTDVTVNDSVTGSSEGQFEYVGTWKHDNYEVEGNYEGDEHWTKSEGASANFRFAGTKIKLYGIKDVNAGIVGIAIDDGEEILVDCHASARQFQELLYESQGLSAGLHTLRIRCTGTKNESATDTVVSLDKVVVTP